MSRLFRALQTRLASRLSDLATRWATPGSGRVALCAPIVGIVAGAGAAGCLVLTESAVRLILGDLLGYFPPAAIGGAKHPIGYPGPWWLVLLIPTLGGLASGLLVFTLAPEAEGHGTDALIRAFHRGGGKIRARVPILKTIATALTIGTGGSAGLEGPIAQVGAGFGSILAKWLRFSIPERRAMVLSGAAGGIGAIFRAPLGGALFAVEVLYSTTAMEAAALLPCLISSIFAYSTFALFLTPEPIFALPDLKFQGLGQLPMFALLALACEWAGWLFIKVFYGLRDYVFHPMPLPPHVNRRWEG